MVEKKKRTMKQSQWKKVRNKHQNIYKEKEVDPPMEREKQKENKRENLGYEDHFQGNQVEV